MTLFETIFTRRSVRKYDKTPLGGETLQKIKDFLAEQKQLGGTNGRFEFVDADAVTDGKAPHYILAYAPKKTAEYVNIGYTLQAVDLFIQSKGLGSVWLGMPSPKDKEAKENYCIMLGFGKTDVPQRESQKDFSRLPLSDISNEPNPLAEAARLAPSAVNQQPWQLVFRDGGVTISYKGRGLLKGLLREKAKIDLGICARHITVAAEKEGKQTKSVTPKDDGKNISVEILFE